MDNQFFLNTGIPELDQSTMPTWQYTSSPMETQSSDQDFPALAIVPSGYFSRPDMIGKQGNVFNSGEIFPPENHPMTGNRTFGPDLPAITGDPGFADRATRLSYFGSRSFNARTGNFACPIGSDFASNSTTLVTSGKLHRVSSSPSLNGSPPIAEKRNLESSSGSGGETGSRPCSSSRKRKAHPNGKCNDIPRPSFAKVVGNGNRTEQKMEEEEADEIKIQNAETTDQNPPEPSKDYIHVRARRGQATDSHSLAERVRREKIGERMKLLQDLVPGCNKVTGKALMLEEIINYVQSLQRQVEFLSMKVACVNPTLDFNSDNLFQKDIYQPNCSMQTQPTYPLDTLAPSLYGASSLQQNGITSSGVGPPCSNPTGPVNHTHDLQLPTLDVLNNGVPKLQSCEGDLHSIVEMGFGQRNQMIQDHSFPTQFYKQDQIKRPL